jgi:hypothetical protein
MYNKILVYCAGMYEVKMLEKIIKETVPSALMVNFCRHSDKLKQAFYGCFDPKSMRQSEDGKITADTGELFDTRMSPNAPTLETYFSVGESEEVEEFIDLDGKPYKVEEYGEFDDDGDDIEYKHVCFEDEYISINEFGADLLVRTTKMLPDVVLMRTDGFMSWNNGELYIHDDDKSKEITQLCTENNVPLIKHAVVEEELEDDGSHLANFKFSLGNEAEVVNELKKIEEQFKQNLPVIT